jgi:Caspase domain
VRSALALGLLLAMTAGAAAEPERVARFAIVIGNNNSERSDTADLRYADDDAVAMHQLLAEAGVESSLFVRLDPESRQLNPDLEVSERPRWSALRERLARIEADIRAAERAGATTSLLLFYSGHGDVAHGEGYVELEDAHLTRTLLRRELLERTSADEVHLVIDACRSYFLAFEKGPGGKRRRAAAPLIERDRSRARTGYILSTSSDRESHEWEAFQGGIFSHEVRSALRGAADADRDGSVTYAELGAFLTVANRGIRNPRFRPGFVVRPPGDLSAELLTWDRPDEQTLLIDEAQGHMLLEGPAGERVLDVHAAEGQTLRLQLPARRPLFLRPAGGTREFAITDGETGPLRLSQLSSGPLRVASKGALHLAFSQLFSAPFSAIEVHRFRADATRADRQRIAGAPLDVTARADAPRSGGGAAAKVAGGTAIVAGIVGLGVAGWTIERSVTASSADQVRRDQLNASVENGRVATGVAFGVAVSSALVWWLLREDEPSDSGLSVAPSAGADGRGAGVALGGFW